MIQIAINPGSGPIKCGTREHSKENIRQLIKDLHDKKGLKRLKFRFKEECDDGRHTYFLYKGKKRVEIDMPALPLNEVRWMDSSSGNIWHFPRLYVAGSSWIWAIALNVIPDDFQPIK